MPGSPVMAWHWQVVLPYTQSKSELGPPTQMDGLGGSVDGHDAQSHLPAKHSQLVGGWALGYSQTKKSGSEQDAVFIGGAAGHGMGVPSAAPPFPSAFRLEPPPDSTAPPLPALPLEPAAPPLPAPPPLPALPLEPAAPPFAAPPLEPVIPPPPAIPPALVAPPLPALP